MEQRRTGVLFWAVDKLSAKVDFIHGRRFTLPDLLSGAMAVCLRRSLNGDNRARQLALEVDRVELVKDVLEGGDRLAHLHEIIGRSVQLSLNRFVHGFGCRLDILLLAGFLKESPTSVISGRCHDSRLRVELIGGHGGDFAILLVNRGHKTNLAALFVDDFLFIDDSHVLHQHVLP